MNLDFEGSSPSNLLNALLSNSGDPDLGALLRQRETELGLSGRQAASVVGLSETVYRSIKNGDTKSFSISIIYQLSYFLEKDVDVVVRAIAVQQMTPEDGARLDRSRERRYIAKNFDIEGLFKIGFINTKSDFDVIRDRIVSFYRLESIFDYEKLFTHALLSRHRRSPREKMRDFYLRSALAQFAKLNNPYEYNPERLFDLTPHIHRATRDVPTGLLRVARALFQLGVTVIPQSSVPGLMARGATMIYNGKPCIVLSDIRGDYSAMWFALMHEIGHVVFHMEEMQTVGYHITGEPDLLMFEDEADRFARLMLFSDDKLDFIEPFIDNPHLVNEYAKKHNIHPSIIYGFYSYRRYTANNDRGGFSRFSSYVVKPDEALRVLRTNPWRNDHYDDTVVALQNELETQRSHAKH